MSHESPASVDLSRRPSRVGTVTLSEALELTPTTIIQPALVSQSGEYHYGIPRATATPTLNLQIPHVGIERHLTLLEAITELKPEPEYTLEEALSSLYAETDQDSSSDDSDVDIFHDPEQRLSKKRLETRKSEAIVKEVTDFLEHAYSPTRRPSLHRQLRALRNLQKASIPSAKDVRGQSNVDPVSRTTIKHNTYLSFIALQLLASTFTPTPNPTCMPAALYMTQLERTQPQMISALKMHSVVSIQAPAAGHHVRSASPAPVWPALLERDREEVLADEVTRRRLDRIRMMRNAESMTPREDLVRQEELVRWMWDPPSRPSGPVDDDVVTSGYSAELGTLRRLNRTPIGSRKESKGKERSQCPSLSTDISANDIDSSSLTALSSQDRLSQRPTSTRSPPFHLDSEDSTSLFAPASPSRPRTPSHFLPAHPRPSSSTSSRIPRMLQPSTSNFHTCPSPPQTPSPLNARLARTGNFEFHPIIRAEPHPVYVQPVKAIAVKRKRFAYAGNRWQRMREREREMQLRHRSARDDLDGGGDNSHDNGSSAGKE